MNPKIKKFIDAASAVILDKPHEINLILAGLLAEGHILIEDVPGVGKTTLIKTIAKLTDLQESRIQMTNDLLPADLLGASIFDTEKKAFVFHPGPFFAQIILVDELNRATPKTQSACLQAMEERKITLDGITHTLQKPFFVIATQNPNQQVGTFPLPESQLDRFLMKIELGYPSRSAEKQILLGERRSSLVDQLQPIFSGAEILQLQKETQAVFVSEPIIEYIQDLVDQTRQAQQTMSGLSPRAATHLVQAAKAWAFLQNRDRVWPEDVQAVAVPVMSHRLNPRSEIGNQSGRVIAENLLRSTAVR